MRTLFKKTALASSILLVSAGFAGVASAHCFNSSATNALRLGSATNTHDLYRLQCFNDGNGDADRVEAAVQKQSANVSGLGVRVQIAREGYSPSAIKQDIGYTSGDSIDEASCTAAGSPASPFAVLQPQTQSGSPVTDANGDYNILVDKTDLHVVSQRYGIIFHCLNAAGEETGTAQVADNTRPPELVGNTTFQEEPGTEADIDLLIDQ
jgi:hypothetical protein